MKTSNNLFHCTISAAVKGIDVTLPGGDRYFGEMRESSRLIYVEEEGGGGVCVYTLGYASSPLFH